jgi:hypothetical protein
VHSDNITVTQALEVFGHARVASWFHAQATDFPEVVTDGTFLANEVPTRIFCLAGRTRIAQCTDLSTDRVDKGKTLLVSAPCMTIVTKSTAVRANPTRPLHRVSAVP